MRTPEGYVRADVKKYLKAIRVYFFSNTTFGYGGSGQPDITACMAYKIKPSDVGRVVGIFTAVELKAPDKEPTALQRQRIAEIRKHGGFAFWSTSVDDVIDKLKKEFGLTE